MRVTGVRNSPNLPADSRGGQISAPAALMSPKRSARAGFGELCTPSDRAPADPNRVATRSVPRSRQRVSEIRAEQDGNGRRRAWRCRVAHDNHALHGKAGEERVLQVPDRTAPALFGGLGRRPPAKSDNGAAQRAPCHSAHAPHARTDTVRIAGTECQTAHAQTAGLTKGPSPKRGAQHDRPGRIHLSRPRGRPRPRSDARGHRPEGRRTSVSRRA